MVKVIVAARFNSEIGECVTASCTRLKIRGGPLDEPSLQLVRPGRSGFLPFECDAIVVVVNEKELR
jgi:hypothetical protein